MIAERTNLADPVSFFRFAIITTLVSVVALTILAAITLAVNMPETFDPANTRGEHWGAVGIIGYLGLLSLLPFAAVIWLFGSPIFKGAMLLQSGPVLAGAVVGSLSWFALFGWLAWENQSVLLLSPIILGAVIGGTIAKK